MSKKLVLIGQNISHSKSPELYNKYFKDNNLDFEYSILAVDKLEEFIKTAKNGKFYAFNVTMPYKVKILKYLDTLDITAKNAESVNLVVYDNGKLIGFNTDGIGFFEGLISSGINPEGYNLCIIGNGGAGKAIASVARNYKINDINIITHKTCDELYKNNILQKRIVLKKLKDSEIIVNATPVGFNDDKNMPLPKYLLDELFKAKLDFCFVDIIYNPKETEMLKYMRANDVYDTFNGEAMLYQQFLANIRILFNQSLSS